MPITNYPFTCIGSIYRPMLPIKIHNPSTGKSFQTWGLIDTGADESAMPAGLAEPLGHELLAGITKPMRTLLK